MTTWHRYLLGACLMLPPAAAPAQAPPAGLGPTQLDQAAADVLKEVHNRGADLYNRGDPAGAYRMYEGALAAVRPFVAHRPAVVKVIEDGLNETAKTDGVKIQAFRLHEVIEQVRADLKAEVAKAAEAKPPAGEPAPTPAVKNPEPPKTPPGSPAPAGAGTLSGVVSAGGKSLAGADVTVVSLDQKLPRVFTATADDAGRYRFAEALPPGTYAVMVTGKGVPAKFTTVGTSPLTTTLGGTAANPLDLKLD